MASNVKIEIDSKGIEQILKGAQVQSLLNDAAQKVISTAEAMCTSNRCKYEAVPLVLETRAIVRVQPANIHTHYANQKEDRLLKALGSVNIE